ncbi:MAG TPA: isoprenylcysteine carboxylmethyltransferase family protein [Bryobacteraceae bacterium]|jgi:protein-S-isoprenylcysteine O-methyltransferase Ste14
MIWNWHLLPFGMLVVSLASFGWAMRNFFLKPTGDNAGMKVIRITSTAFAILHLGAILLTPDVPLRQSLAASSIYVLALVLFFWAIRANSISLSAAFSSDSPQHLVQRGPYRWIRHPFYCAYLLTWSAGFVATGRWWLLPSIAVMVAVYLRAARLEEEKFASSPLAGAYQDYRESTGRFLPKLRAQK